MEILERGLALQVLDRHWKQHLGALEHLRGGIHLRAYAQRNPRQEYQREAFAMFEKMIDAIRGELVRVLMRLRIDGAGHSQEHAERLRLQQRDMTAKHGELFENPPEAQNASPSGKAKNG